MTDNLKDNISSETSRKPVADIEKPRKKFTSTIAGASILLTAVGLISRGFGLVREIVFANSFGLSKAYDLFLVGTVIPLTLNTIIIYIAQNYFIPIYNRLKSNSPDQAKSFILKSFMMFVSGGLIIMFILFFFSMEILSLYVNNTGLEELRIAVIVLKIYAVTIPFNAAFSVLSAYLYSEFEFKIPTVSQLFINIAIIISVIFFSTGIGVISIAYGYLLGIILQLGFICVYIFRSEFNLFPLNLTRTKLYFSDSSLVFIILIEALSQIYLISDRYFLSQVDKGGIAALNYSMNIYLLPITIISAALSTALFPSFSKSFVENNFGEIKEKLAKFFSINLYIFVPIAFVMFFFGDVLIKILFEHGAFKSNDVLMTFRALKFFSISLIFFACYMIMNKLLYSFELIRQLLLITILGCGIKIFFNFILVSNIRQDGLALSSSISYIFFFGSALYLIKRKIGIRINKTLTPNLFYNACSAAIALFLSKIIIHLSGQFLEINFISQILEIVFFLTIYIINSSIIDKESLRLIFNVLTLRNNKIGV